MPQQHRILRAVRYARAGVAILGLVVALISAGVGVWRWYFAFMNFGPAVLMRVSMPAFIVSAVAALTAITGLVTWLHARSQAVSTNKSMLRIHGMWRTLDIPWSKIIGIRTASVRYGISKRGLHLRSWLHLRLDEGRRFRITDRYERYEELIHAIKTRVYPRVLESYRAEFNAGNALDFGELVLEAAGLKFRRTPVPWGSIQESHLDRGELRILYNQDGRERKLRIPSHRLVNVELCYQLIQQLSKRADV
jgi:hypothetical protein